MTSVRTDLAGLRPTGAKGFELEEDGAGFARVAILILVAAVAAFVGWAAVTPVRSVVAADGVVLPEGFLRRVDHLEGGIVGEVLAREGLAVAQGDVLVRFDQRALEADLRRMRARNEGLSLEIDRQRSFAIGDGVLSDAGDGAIARSNVVALDVAGAHREARLRLLRSEIDLRGAELAALIERRAALTTELEITGERFRLYDEVFQRSGAISGAQRDDAHLRKIRLEREAMTLESEIRAAELRARMAVESEAEFVAAARKEALTRVAELEAQRAEVVEEIARIETALARGVVVAPVAGRVQALGAAHPGQVLAPGSLVVEIVPDGAPLFVEVRLPASQIGDVAVGMDASIKATTFDYLRHGDASGAVESISPTSEADPDGQLRYRLRIRLAADHVGTGERLRRLQPGMTVTAELRTGSRTVLEALLRPLRVVRDRALTET